YAGTNPRHPLVNGGPARARVARKCWTVATEPHEHGRFSGFDPRHLHHSAPANAGADSCARSKIHSVPARTLTRAPRAGSPIVPTSRLCRPFDWTAGAVRDSWTASRHNPSWSPTGEIGRDSDR